MHVGLNLLYLVPGETGGTEIYARELIPELVAAAPEARFTAFVNREATDAGGGPWGDLIEMVTVPIRATSRFERVRGEQQLLPPLARRANVDLVHSLANTAPAWGAFRQVVTVHDLIYQVVPEARAGLRARGMRLLLPLAARRSDRVIVNATATSEDLQSRVGISSAKIDIVPLGIGSTQRAAPLPESQVRRWLGAGDRAIVLSVSAKLPHKNLPRLIGALATIPASDRPLLVLPGYPTPHEEELRRRAAQVDATDDVRLLGWVSAEQLESLYSAAACFVFPSLYEGFGLPVLEAMARDTPVACSDRGALLEVAGEAALLFDPESEQAIAAAIERLLTDPAEAQRLRRAGHERVQRFTWSATARGTIRSYQRALETRR